MKGKKTGGRRPGSRNRRTVAKQAAIVAAYDAGLTPLDYMLGILRDENANRFERMDAAAKAAPYIHPKLASIEHAGRDGGPIELKEIKIRLVKAGEE
jgi:hypothetical protein